MDKNKIKLVHRKMRHSRVRAKIVGTAKKPRISVFRSNNNFFVQFVDDESGKTLISNSSDDLKKFKGKKIEEAKAIGEALAEKAKKAGINEAVFDRGGYKFHGRVKALADGLRSAGIKI